MLSIRSVVLATAASIGFLSALPAQAEERAVCYNCPPEWADWKSELEAIKRDTGINVPMDNKNSGQSLAQLIAERNNPIADVVYYGVTFAIQAEGENVITNFKPEHFDSIPTDMKHPDGLWFAIHSGTIGLMVNTAALGDVPVPKSWNDLLKPEYDGLVGYLDPSSAFVGYAGATAINLALGGDLDNYEPVLKFFADLKENHPIVPKQTSYARVLSGEIPIFIDYDFNAYRAKYDDQAPIEFVIPTEGTISVPYVMSKVKDSPNPENAEKVLNHTLSDEGQKVWAEAYLRPIRAEAMSEEARSKFLPDADYERAQGVDYAKMAEAQKGFAEEYLKRGL